MSEGTDHTIDDYELLCVIGKGVFGKIFLVKELKTGHVHAMKVVKKRLIEKSNKLKYIFTERNVLIEVPFPNPAEPPLHHPRASHLPERGQVLLYPLVLPRR
jgi:serine/threonine protein kinase